MPALATAIAPALTLLLFGACESESANSLPPALRNRMAIEVTGSDFKWRIRYPGDDGRLGTSDDFVRHRHLRLPQGVPVTIVLRSEDYLYGFEVPHFGINKFALPDVSYSVELMASKTGRFALLGNQMCGYTHPNLLGEVRVESQPDFARWWRDTQSM